MRRCRCNANSKKVSLQGGERQAGLELSTYRIVTKRYNINTTALHNWKKQPEFKVDKNYQPQKIDNQALIEDVAKYPNDYQ